MATAWVHGLHPWQRRIEAAKLWLGMSIFPVLAVVVIARGGWRPGIWLLLVGGLFLAVGTLIHRHRNLCIAIAWIQDPSGRQEYDRWAPLEGSRMVSPWWLRACGLFGALSLIAFPVHVLVTHRISESLIFLGVALLAGYATVFGFVLQSRRVDAYLVSRRYRVCPRCKTPLERRRDPHEVFETKFEGECPRCGLAYTQEWLERTWKGMQERVAQARAARGRYIEEDR
jgi:ribosomal protein S27AE